MVNWYKNKWLFWLILLPYDSAAQPAHLSIPELSFGRLFTDEVFREKLVNTKETTIVVDLSSSEISMDDLTLVPVPAPRSLKKTVQPEDWIIHGFATQANGQLGIWLKEMRSGKKVFKEMDPKHWRMQDGQAQAEIDGELKSLQTGLQANKRSKPTVKRYEVR